MRIQETIKKDLIIAMKARDEEKKSALRVILGEFGRMDSKELSDDEVIKICKKLIKSEKEVLAVTSADPESRYIRIIEAYLPDQASIAEIRRWIEENIDFASLQNKMQAMGIIMKHFGTTADGNEVRKILQEI